jgi:hypothetical protein
VMLLIKLFTGVSWQWYVLIGSLTTFSVGYLASQARFGATKKGLTRSENVGDNVEEV